MVGVKINQMETGFELSQLNLVNKILTKSWDGVSRQQTPLPEGFAAKFNKDEAGINHAEYVSIIGSLNYVSVGARPDIT